MAGTTPPRRTERISRAEADDGAATDLVAVKESCVGGRYSYHPEFHDDGTPICNAGPPETEYVLRSRDWATQRWLSPCQRCEELADTE